MEKTLVEVTGTRAGHASDLRRDVAVNASTESLNLDRAVTKISSAPVRQKVVPLAKPLAVYEDG